MRLYPLILSVCLIALPVTPAFAADNDDNQIVTTLEQEQLDSVLSPIALYPDSLLSHILVASTYPLELVQAQRWREQNTNLTPQQALDKAEKFDWDPSVVALVAFNDLLDRLVDDLNWLQQLGDAVLSDETLVLERIQSLRAKAVALGNINSNEYQTVTTSADNEIEIATPIERVVYVPYYDTRVIYGHDYWHHYEPVYWHSPAISVWHHNAHWGVGIELLPRFWFSGFHWHRRHVVVNYDVYHYPRHHTRDKKVRVTEYSRWQHATQHRRGARYASTSHAYQRHTANKPRVGNVQRDNTAHHRDRQPVMHERKSERKEFKQRDWQQALHKRMDDKSAQTRVTARDKASEHQYKGSRTQNERMEVTTPSHKVSKGYSVKSDEQQRTRQISETPRKEIKSRPSSERANRTEHVSRHTSRDQGKAKRERQ